MSRWVHFGDCTNSKLEMAFQMHLQDMREVLTAFLTKFDNQCLLCVLLMIALKLSGIKEVAEAYFVDPEKPIQGLTEGDGYEGLFGTDEL